MHHNITTYIAINQNITNIVRRGRNTSMLLLDVAAVGIDSLDEMAGDRFAHVAQASLLSIAGPGSVNENERATDLCYRLVRHPQAHNGAANFLT